MYNLEHESIAYNNVVGRVRSYYQQYGDVDGSRAVYSATPKHDTFIFLLIGRGYVLVAIIQSSGTNFHLISRTQVGISCGRCGKATS